jgi:hypothetical protein
MIICDYVDSTTTATTNSYDNEWVIIVDSADFPEINTPEEVKCSLNLFSKIANNPKIVNEFKLKSRMNVKIHNPPGGWGMGRF